MGSLFETGVRPAIDEYMLRVSKERRDYGKYWSASSAGYCMRKVIFDRLGVPHAGKPDLRKYRVFESGKIFHEWIQTLTKDAGLSVASEVELIDDDLMVKGHFDDLVKLDDNLILYDYKTANSMSFNYKKDKMSHYHRMQLGTYMYMVRNMVAQIDQEALKDPQALKEARILTISKDDLRMAEAQLLWTPDLEKDVVGYWKTLNGYWDKQVLPACTCDKFEINKKTGKGFMADERFNPYYYDGEPCSLKWYKKWKGDNDASK